MVPDDYSRALDGFETILTAVPADRWESPFPCAEWRAADVAGHLIGGRHMIREPAAGRPRPDVNSEPCRYAGDREVAELFERATASPATPEQAAPTVRAIP